MCPAGRRWQRAGSSKSDGLRAARMSQHIYISDTNIWIDFQYAGLLDALFSLPFTYVSTDFVLEELTIQDADDLRARGLVVQGLDGDVMLRLSALMASHNNSSLADVSCYLLARDTSQPLLTGDGRLRRQAQRDGLQVHGALWLLDQLVAHKVIELAVAAAGLRVMLEAGARLPEDECRSRIERWSV